MLITFRSFLKTEKQKLNKLTVMQWKWTEAFECNVLGFITLSAWQHYIGVFSSDNVLRTCIFETNSSKKCFVLDYKIILEKIIIGPSYWKNKTTSPEQRKSNFWMLIILEFCICFYFSFILYSFILNFCFSLENVGTFLCIGTKWKSVHIFFFCFIVMSAEYLLGN